MKNIEKLLQSAKTPSPDVSNFQRELRGRITTRGRKRYVKAFYVSTAIAACMMIAFFTVLYINSQAITEDNLSTDTPLAVNNPTDKQLPSPEILQKNAVQVPSITVINDQPTTYYEVIIVEDTEQTF